MTAAETLLSHLDGVRARGPDQWAARCPGPLHERGDKSGGLGIKQADDRVLIHCPAGCTPLEIVSAVGLDLRDLFEKRITDSAVAPGRQPPFPTEMARKLLHNAFILVLAAGDLRHGKKLSDADQSTVETAFREIDLIVGTVETWPKAVRHG